MEEVFEAVAYTRTPTLADLFSFTEPREYKVRQLGERLDIPSGASIIYSTPFLPKEHLDAWINNYVNLPYAQYLKTQISKNDWKEIRRLFINLDNKILAKIWPDFVNFEKRRRKEIPFILTQLKEYKTPKVFDACLGSGATTFGLKLEGVENIVSNEIDNDLIAIAQQEANKLRVHLNINSHDWRDLKKVYHEEFNAVLCLGNSLTYLFKRKDQLKTLKNFYEIIKPTGKLIIDERNYAEHFLKGKKMYKFSGKIVYCGDDKVKAHPIHVSKNMIVMEYQPKNGEERAHLVMYPFKAGEMKALLKRAGFRDIQTFGDYKKEFNPEQPEFITYVAKK